MSIVFLDRDGVINEYPGHGYYVDKVKAFKFIPGAVDAIARLSQAGHTLFVISNQAGVAKKLYTKATLKAIDAVLHKGVKAAGGKIRKVYYCTHPSDGDCDCRKPGIGNIKKALKSIGKDLRAAKSGFFAGDTQIDIEAGHKAGCTTILVESGRDRAKDTKKWKIKPDHIVKTLNQAADLIDESTGHTRNRRGRA